MNRNTAAGGRVIPALALLVILAASATIVWYSFEMGGIGPQIGGPQPSGTGPSFQIIVISTLTVLLVGFVAGVQVTLRLNPVT